VHALSAPAKLQSLSDALKGLVKLVLPTREGSRTKLSDRPSIAQPPTEDEWSAGLTVMRKVMADRINARIALGGRTSGYKGKMPGIADEALIQLGLCS